MSFLRFGPKLEMVRVVSEPTRFGEHNSVSHFYCEVTDLFAKKLLKSSQIYQTVFIPEPEQSALRS